MDTLYIILEGSCNEQGKDAREFMKGDFIGGVSMAISHRMPSGIIARTHTICLSLSSCNFSKIEKSAYEIHT